MFLAWYFTPTTIVNAVIIDKTVLNQEAQEHSVLYWLLHYKKYTKPSNKYYQKNEDYYGFFPKEDEEFEEKGLEEFSDSELKKLSDTTDFVYITDTYGIYTKEWFSKEQQTERSSLIYGGLKSQDVKLLKLLKQQHKLIITEFNTFASPTSSKNRRDFEELFNVEWTGWTGRYFATLDTLLNPELPRWLIKNYKEQHKNTWPFKKSGIAFVHANNTVIVLEDSLHLEQPLPKIISNNYGEEYFNLPASIKYPFWFDVIKLPDTINKTAANFQITPSKKGKKELAKYGIPTKFPAVTYHSGDDYTFYYFSGDFSDNTINFNFSYFKGIGFFNRFFYDQKDPLGRESFFWKFYKPMLQQILEDYIER
ncbi:hypothetical protein [Zunongwangia sp.]|uniref:hypothetical protein n=1 Tax=Zunongwangia sp. TaxID=1965325 RepID=UPI003AA7D95A